MNEQTAQPDVVKVIRILTTEDAAVYHQLRLQALKNHPEAYASSFEEESQLTAEQAAERLANPASVTFGIFMNDELVGIVTLVRNTRNKLRHRAMIVAMYVAPQARGQAAGKALLEAAVREARSHDEIEDVKLDVTVGNQVARSMYVSAGFQHYGVEPRQINVNGHYYDTEMMLLSLRETETND